MCVCSFRFMNYSVPLFVFHALHVYLYVQYICAVTVSCLPDICMCVFIYKSSFIFSAFSSTLQDSSPLLALMENVTQSHSYMPHYLLRDDPFASKLSREADIVAAFYICIIGQSNFVKNVPSSSLHVFMYYLCSFHCK